MSFKLLLTAIAEGKTEDATKLAAGLEGDFEANVSEITKLEQKASEAIDTRDKTKSKLRKLAEAAGVDELTVESIGELKSKRGDDSEIEKALKGQITDLEGKIESLDTDYKGQLSTKESVINDMTIDRELSKMGVGKDAINDEAKGDIIKQLKNGVSIEEGKVVYKDESGNPIRNDKGRPITVEDQLESLKGSKAYLFKAQGKGGSGEHHQAGGGDNSVKRSSMNHAQKAEYISKHGNEAYLSLPN